MPSQSAASARTSSGRRVGQSRHGDLLASIAHARQRRQSAAQCQRVTHRAVVCVQRSLGQSGEQERASPGRARRGAPVPAGRRRVGRRVRVAQDHVESGQPRSSRARSCSDTTAARRRRSRSPFLVIRSTSTSSAARNAATARGALLAASAGSVDAPPAGLQPVGERAAGRRPRPRARRGPSGSASSRCAWTAAGSTTSASAISRYSASLADPVGAAPAYEIRGCGLKPEE